MLSTESRDQTTFHSVVLVGSGAPARQRGGEASTILGSHKVCQSQGR